MRRAVFLDKDGTLVRDVPYNVDPRRIELLPGVREACARLHGAGFRLIVVTNQSGVARGYFPEEALFAVEARLREIIGVPLSDFLYCPHADSDGCSCRKPQPGMLHRAAGRHAIDLSQSWMVGDILNDVEAGSRAGCRTILIDNGGETEWLTGEHRVPDARVPDMVHAAAIVTRPKRQAA